MKRSVIAGTGIVVLAGVILMLIIVVPREEPTQLKASPATSGRDFFALPEKPRTDDGKAFKPDWD